MTFSRLVNFLNLLRKDQPVSHQDTLHDSPSSIPGRVAGGRERVATLLLEGELGAEFVN